MGGLPLHFQSTVTQMVGSWSNALVVLSAIHKFDGSLTSHAVILWDG